jgi:hypothetical protein
MLSFMKYKIIQLNISKKPSCGIDMNEKRHEYLLDDTLKVDKTTVSVLELLETIKIFSLSMI